MKKIVKISAYFFHNIFALPEIFTNIKSNLNVNGFFIRINSALKVQNLNKNLAFRNFVLYVFKKKNFTFS